MNSATGGGLGPSYWLPSADVDMNVAEYGGHASKAITQ
jgi:hypothetical protein